MATNQAFLPPFTSSDVKIIKRKIVYDGYFKMLQYTLSHPLFAGGESQPFDREVFDRGNSVGVLLFDPRWLEVVLVQQFRLGALNDEKTPWLLEIVAGAVESHESNLLDVAFRETKEESGLDIQDIVPITQYWVSPGGSSEQMTLYCAKVNARHAFGLHGLDEENEDIRVLTLPVKEAWKAVDDNGICNGPSIIALQWLRIHYDTLLAKWG